MRVLAASPSSVRLAWAAPPSGGPPAEYRVQYARENSDGDIASPVETPASPAGTRELVGLEEGTRYRVELRAANAHEDDTGAPLVASFAPLRPPPAPTAVRVTAVRSSSISIAWDWVGAPAVRFFNVTVASDALDRPALQFHPEAARLVDVQQLQPGTPYALSVAACNLAGCSAPATRPPIVTAPRQVAASPAAEQRDAWRALGRPAPRAPHPARRRALCSLTRVSGAGVQRTDHGAHRRGEGARAVGRARAPARLPLLRALPPRHGTAPRAPCAKRAPTPRPLSRLSRPS
jgi:hypothetical protein